MITAARAFAIGLSDAREPCDPLICHNPKSFVGEIAPGLPPLSAIATSAATNALAELPPTERHRDSNIAQL
jgi:hypothetical protein